MKPHLRQVEGHWLCTHDRTERHFLRGYWGDTPMQAYSNFTFHEHMKEIADKWKSKVVWHKVGDKKICQNELVGKPA